MEVEIEAFADFNTQVAEMGEKPPLTDGGERRIAPLQRRRQIALPSKCGSVCQAYDDTVLSMFHYMAEYGESLEEHMAAEFGQDIVINLFQSREFPQQLKRALLDASRRSRRQREELLTKLEAEIEAMKSAHTTLTSIVDSLLEFNSRPLGEYTPEEFSDIRRRLNEFEAECKRVASDRKNIIRSEDGASIDGSEQEFRAYLYRELDTEYPILSDIAKCCQLLQEARGNVEDEVLMRRNFHGSA